MFLDRLNGRPLYNSLSLEASPKKATLDILLNHLRDVLKHQKNNKIDLTSLTNIFTATLMHPNQQTNRLKFTKYRNFLKFLIETSEGNSLPDLLPETVRGSTYDNVHQEELGEADILDDYKTESSRL